MPLFASLSKTEAFSDAQDPSSKQPGFPPTAVQFYSTKSIDLTSNSIKKYQSQSSSFAPLSYDAVTIQTSIADAITADASSTRNPPTKTNAGSGSSADSNANPNLGVWNCRINQGSSTPSELLKACLPSMNDLPTFILTLDLDEQNLNLVHPIMSTMLSNIIDYCTSIENGNGKVKDAENSNDTNSNENEFPVVPQGTTNLAQLKSTIFGKAPLDDSDGDGGDDSAQQVETGVNVNGPASSPISVNLIICGIFTKKKDVTYREKQAANLVSYHLQKFASALNCTLCFVRDEGIQEDSEDGVSGDAAVNSDGNGEIENGAGDRPGGAFRPRGMTVIEFGRSLKMVCVSAAWDEAVDADVDGFGVGGGDATEMGGEVQQLQQEQEQDGQQPSHYGPYDYDVDLINSVLLRGAGCPGVWNANTDSLWVALPPMSAADKEKLENNSTAGEQNAKARNGDQEWLGKLADSVNAYVGNSGGASDGKSVKSSMDQTVRTTRTSANGTVVTKKKVARKKPTASGDKKDSQDVQDFFAGLLNK
jgi:hypothetical protein